MTGQSPLDPFIERYMPDASADEREEGRANLERFVAVLVRIDDRIEREKQDAIRQISDSAVDSDSPLTPNV
jgi:hypothetical protein